MKHDDGSIIWFDGFGGAVSAFEEAGTSLSSEQLEEVRRFVEEGKFPSEALTKKD